MASGNGISGLLFKNVWGCMLVFLASPHTNFYLWPWQPQSISIQLAHNHSPSLTCYSTVFAHMQPQDIIMNHCTQPQSIRIQYSPQPQPVYSIMNNHSPSAHSIANNHRLSAYVAISTIQRVHMYQWNNWKSQLGSSNYVLTNATRRMFGAHRHLLKQNCRCCHNWWGAEGNQLSAREETAEEKRMHEEIIGFHL